MKLIFTVCTLFLTAGLIKGQNQVGIFAGAHSSSARYLVFNEEQEVSMKPGFHLGVNMKVPFEGNLYFNPAAFYSMKGYDVKFTGFTFPPDNKAINNSTTIHTFELAALLQYDLSKNSGHFFIRLGPSLDFQLFGKEKFDLADGTTVSRNMKWSQVDYGRYAANLIGQFGYETGSGFTIFGHYTLGEGSINNADFGPRIRHRLFGLSIGKYIKNKR
ncbi:MAG: PorT family protein [Chitinophagaceae bacterium]|nr:PorT family protein [Chitinophagaceae bacterium]